MDFNKPGPNKRVCAFFIDLIIGEILGGLFSLALSRDIGWIICAIFILFKDCVNGQSIGKYSIGTQVVDENNLPAKFYQTVIRNIFVVIPLFIIIEYIIMLRDKDSGKRIGDNIAKTKVNDLKPQVHDSIFLWISIALLIISVVIQLGIGFILLKQQSEGTI